MRFDHLLGARQYILVLEEERDCQVENIVSVFDLVLAKDIRYVISEVLLVGEVVKIDQQTPMHL